MIRPSQLILFGLVFMPPSLAEATWIELDLADIVGGGNGTGTGGDQGIDPRDGSVKTTQTAQLSGISPNAYRAVGANALIDGVVIPNGGADMMTPVPVSSTMLTVTGIPSTDDRSWDYIWNGFNFRVTTDVAHDTVLGMHANKGVTFDLLEVEKANPGFEASGFSSRLVMGEDPTVPGVFGVASLFVILDGLILEAVQLSAPPNAVEFVSIDISPSSRFLTLLTTSDGSTFSDHTMFLDPFLTLELVPEPGTLALIGLDLAGLGFARRQCREHGQSERQRKPTCRPGEQP